MMQDIRTISKKPRQATIFPQKIASATIPVAVRAKSRVAGDVEVSVQDSAARDAGRLPAAQEQLMIDHLPIVRFIARRIHERLPQHVPLEDLLSAGVLGLMDAFNKFDPEKQVQFRSYAQFRIRGAILDSLRTLDWSPRELRRKGRAVEQAIQKLTARCGRPPGDVEIAGELGLTLAEYQNLLGDLKGLEIGTLHAERSEDSGEEELAYLPNRPEDDPLFRCLHGELRQRLADAVGELPERERLVMTFYYYEELTMKEIGLILGVVESRVSQIHASAVLHLRAKLADLAGLTRRTTVSNHRHTSAAGQAAIPSDRAAEVQALRKGGV